MSITLFREALEEVLRCDRLDVAKEIAADALDVDINDYVDEDEVCAGSAYDFEDEVEYSKKDVLDKFM
jgi:hypothetical protein